MSTEQSPDDICDVRKIDQVRWAYTEGAESHVMAAPQSFQDRTINPPAADRLAPQSAIMLTAQRLLEGFTLVPSFKRTHGGMLAALRNLCNFSSLCAVLKLPAAAAAYELEKDVIVTGYGTMSTGTILLLAAVSGTILRMVAIFISSVHDSVRGHSRITCDSVRGCLEKCWYMGWVVPTLLVEFIILASAISDVNLLTAGNPREVVDPITGL